MRKLYILIRYCFLWLMIGSKNHDMNTLKIYIENKELNNPKVRTKLNSPQNSLNFLNFEVKYWIDRLYKIHLWKAIPTFIWCFTHSFSFWYIMLCVQPQSLALLEEDIREVLKEETGADIFTHVQNQPQFRSYEVLATHAYLFSV